MIIKGPVATSLKSFPIFTTDLCVHIFRNKFIKIVLHVISDIYLLTNLTLAQKPKTFA